jgi:prolyl-tRNA editing enzyme YbaK/EbsC (Cys-tRNA(Pro) deacylase)
MMEGIHYKRRGSIEQLFNAGLGIDGMEPASARLLEEKGVEYRLIELSDKAVTVEDVVRYAKGGVDPDEICKTIILKDKGGLLHAVFLRGRDRIDFRKLRGVIGKASVAAPDKVKEAAGVRPGAVCPLTLDIPLYVDKRVFDIEKVNFGSGNHLYGIELASRDLAKAMDFKVVDAAEV